jgi:hypothetical protein
MTAVRTLGNLRGSRIESVIGMILRIQLLVERSGGNVRRLHTKPMPSKANTAVLTKNRISIADRFISVHTQ